MQMKTELYAIIILTLLLTGCSYHETKTVEVLTQEVRELNTTDKQHIYKLIEKEIALYNKKGDRAFKAKEYHNALKYYKMVNFYKGYSYISDKKINLIKRAIYRNSIYHYRRALNAQNAREELKEFNSVMMYNPDYKKTRLLYKKSLLKRKNKIFVNSLENDLYTKLLEPNHSLKNIKDINKRAKELHQYKYFSDILIQAEELIEAEHKQLLQNAIALYRENRLSDAKRSFISISSIYKNDSQSKKYLQKIKYQEQKKLILSKASEAFINKEYKDAIKYANNVLSYNPNSKKAKKILSDSTKLIHEQVEKLLIEGKYNYVQKRLEKAKEIFDTLLNIDNKNTTALLYKSKIERQLETITSLE
jgi:hypothetical protein